jgi:hypothetical protein
MKIKPNTNQSMNTVLKPWFYKCESLSFSQMQGGDDGVEDLEGADRRSDRW